MHIHYCAVLIFYMHCKLSCSLFQPVIMHAKCSSVSVTRLQRSALLRLLITPPTIISLTVCAAHRPDRSSALSTFSLYSLSFSHCYTAKYKVTEIKNLQINRGSCYSNLHDFFQAYKSREKLILAAAVQMANTCWCSQVSLSHSCARFVPFVCESTCTCTHIVCVIHQIGLSLWPAHQG